jgi:hypothetical protein
VMIVAISELDDGGPQFLEIAEAADRQDRQDSSMHPLRSLQCANGTSDLRSSNRKGAMSY